jgi:hypothetical protein
LEAIIINNVISTPPSAVDLMMNIKTCGPIPLGAIINNIKHLFSALPMLTLRTYNRVCMLLTKSNFCSEWKAKIDILSSFPTLKIGKLTQILRVKT